jgi:hypothetical protein
VSRRVLTIGKGSKPFTLPLQLETTTQAILARKRSGKSYTAKVEAEELIEAGEQIAVIDPTAAYYGLRSSANGKGKGYPVVIFGGDHADAPLDFRTGKAMAAALIDHGFSAIYDINSMDFDEQVIFVWNFAAELLRRNRKPLHLFIDEADTFAPQMLENRDQKKCLGTVSRLVKQGGGKGLGVTLITQRPADLNKKVLSQVEMVTALRMSHKLDIDPVIDWIRRQVNEEFAVEVEAALPKLKVGEGFFCSDSLGIGGQLVQIRRLRTFDSSATPKVGEVKQEPKVLAAIDIKKLGREIAASAEKLKQESPEFLMKQVAELKAQLAKGGKNVGFIEEAQAAHEELERLRKDVAELRVANAEIPTKQARIDELERRAVACSSAIVEALRALTAPTAVVPGKVIVHQPGKPPKDMGQPKPMYETGPTSISSGTLTPPAEPKHGGLQTRLLRSLAEFQSIGRTEVPRATLSTWGGARGGYFDRTVSGMVTAGLIIYPTPGMIALTPLGFSQAPKIETPPTPEASFNRVVAMSGGGLNERLLRSLRSIYPQAIGRADLGVMVDSSAEGGYFARSISALKTAGFIEYPAPATVRLAPWTVMEDRDG